MAERLRIATYNIHKCIGRDGRCDPDRISAILRRIDADIVALQEFHTQYRPGDPLLNARDFASALGYEAVEQPTRRRGRQHQSNLLLSRWPARSVESLDLSVPPLEKRGAILAGFEVGGTTLRVAATHLALSPAARPRQLEQLLGKLFETEARAHILLGDLNEWIPGGAVERLLSRRFGPLPEARSFPAALPLLSLDRALASPARIVGRVHAPRGGATAIASDHLPVVADIDLSKAG